MRSYLGAPLRYRGAVVGSVSVMGTEPRAFSDDGGPLYGEVLLVTCRLPLQTGAST